MKEDERLQIIQALRIVDFAIVSLDKDRTVRKSLGLIAMFSQGKRIAFANGGDQTNETIPEREVCEELGIELIDGLGDKVQSSSWLLKE